MNLPSPLFSDWKAEDLEETIHRFEALQEELTYQQAQQSLRGLVQQIDLTAQEQQGLEAEISHLSTLLERLEDSIIQIAAFGLVGRGKSSILNALLGEDVFEAGPLHGVTRRSEAAPWQLTTDPDMANIQRLTLEGWGNSQIQLIDTPGIDEIDGEARELMARKIAKQVDLILFVIAGDMTKVEFEALSQLREAGKPMLLVFNKIDQYPEADRNLIYQKIRDERVKELLSPEEIVKVAASPLIPEAIRNAEGKVRVEYRREKPQIQDLKLKILDILHREGKSLVALNTMLFADEVNEQMVQRKMLIRDRAANQLIQKAVMTKAVAIALNPVTVIDLLTGAVIDVAMILSLSRLYGIAMTQPGAIALLQKICISMGSITSSEFLATLGLSSLKGLLGLSTPLTGGLALAPYFSIALTQAGVAGLSGYAIGQVTKTYLANDASWGPDGPKAVVQCILASLDEESILSRIKEELREKLNAGNLRRL
jgi:GTP-binding protein Era